MGFERTCRSCSGSGEIDDYDIERGTGGLRVCGSCRGRGFVVDHHDDFDIFKAVMVKAGVLPRSELKPTLDEIVNIAVMRFDEERKRVRK